MSDWETSTLGEIGEGLAGLTYSPSQVTESGGTLVLRSSNIQNGTLALDDTVFVNAQVSDKIRVQPSDILLCVRNGSRRLIGKSLYLDERVEGQTFGAFMTVFRSPMNDYLRYFFQSDEFKRQVDEHLGATINQITNRSLKSFVVTHPGFREQKEISDRLNDLDDLVELSTKLLSKKRAIKQGMMQELLTGRTRLPGFEGEWEETTLGAISRIKTGSRNNQDKVKNGTYPFFVRSATIERIDTYSYDKEAILVPGEGGIGSIFHYVSGKFEVHQRVYMISDFLSDVVGRFVYYYLREFFGTHAMEHSVKATVDSLRLPTFKSFKLRLPPTRVDQDAIAEVLCDADAEIAALERRLETTRAIKQGMMQELLSGRTRLPLGEDVV